MHYTIALFLAEKHKGIDLGVLAGDTDAIRLLGFVIHVRYRDLYYMVARDEVFWIMVLMILFYPLRVLLRHPRLCFQVMRFVICPTMMSSFMGVLIHLFAGVLSNLLLCCFQLLNPSLGSIYFLQCCWLGNFSRRQDFFATLMYPGSLETQTFEQRKQLFEIALLFLS